MELFRYFLEVWYKDNLRDWWSEGIAKGEFDDEEFEALYAQLVNQNLEYDEDDEVYKDERTGATYAWPKSTPLKNRVIPAVPVPAPLDWNVSAGYMFMYGTAAPKPLNDCERGRAARRNAEGEYRKLRRAFQESKRHFEWNQNDVRSEEVSFHLHLFYYGLTGICS